MATSRDPSDVTRVSLPAESDAAADLPLRSIPSVPDEAVEREPARGGLAQVVFGFGLFGLIVAAALLGARYMQLPKRAVELPAPEERVIDPSAAHPRAESAPAPARAAGDSPAHSLPPLAPPAPPGEELTRLQRELAARDQALAREREARAGAERKLAEAIRAGNESLKALRAQQATAPGKAGRAEKLDRKGQRRLKELETQLAALRKELDAARREASSAAERARALELAAGDFRKTSDLAEKRARSAEQSVEQDRARHQAALKGEAEAVRKLVADLNEARRQAESERQARLDAERRLREADGAGGARQAAAARGLERPAREPRLPAPGAAATIEPQREKIIPPRYPDELRRSGVSGRVVLRVLVGESGNVEDVEVVSSPDPRLAAAAAPAARRWQYSPGRKDGVRSKMWITEQVDFRP